MLNAVRNPERIASLGLASFPFARHYLGNLGWFLFLALLRCFSSGGFPHIPIWFSIWWSRFAWSDCSIRKSADQSVLTTPRSLSQLIASFFGSQCQGIRPALFLALPFASCFPEFSLNLLLIQNTCSFLPDKNYYLYRITRSILICITFALFSFQVSFLFLRTDFSNQFLDYSNLFLSPWFFLLSYFSGGHKWTRTIDLTLIRRAL